MDPKLRDALERLLSRTDDGTGRGPGLAEDAQRLWLRIERFIAMNLVAPGVDTDAMELACYAMQLPMRQLKAVGPGRLGQVSLRERSEQAAELLVSLLRAQAEEELLDRTARLLHEIPQRTPMIEEARLLADSLNLDDFGLTGLLLQAVQIGRQGGGLRQLAEGIEKRRQYGYWQARLKDGFHFEPIRQLARKRLEAAADVADLLLRELREDQTP